MLLLFFCSTRPQQLAAQGGTYCSLTYNYAVTNQSTSALFPGGGTWTAGSVIKVSGTFTINQNITLDDLDFIMTPGSSIEITGSSTTATIRGNSRFFGCYEEEMWLGIVVTSGAKILMSGGTVVEDALVGIEITRTANTSASKLENSFLYDNLVGLKMNGPGTFKLAAFSGMTIKKVGALLPPPSPYTYTGSKMLRGILLANATADFSLATKRNKIEDCRYGIYLLNSKLTLVNTTFSNSANDAAVSDTLDGTDIYAVSSTVTIGGAGSANCVFFNAQNSGIISNDTRGLFVTGADFDVPNKYAIRCVRSNKLSTPIRIEKNDFFMNATDVMVAAIYVERPSGSTTTEMFNRNTLINDNFFELTSGHLKNAPLILIDVQGKKDANDVVQISNNKMNNLIAWPHVHGIRVTGKGNNYHVLNLNNLSWTASATPSNAATVSRGIIAANLAGSNHRIENNDLLAKLSSTNRSYLRSGIHLENNPFKVLVCSNRLDSTYHNIFCTGGLPNTQLKTNLMDHAVFGLFCKTGTDMPNQDRFENRWVGTYATRGAEYEGGAPTFFIFTDPSSAITDDRPSTINPSSGWFDDLSGSNNSCGFSTILVTDKEREFIDGTQSPDNTADNWDTRRGLLYKLMRFPEIVENDEDAEDYLADQETANSSPWRYARAEWLFDQAYALTAIGLESDIEEQMDAFRFWCDSLNSLDVEQEQDTTFDTGIAEDRLAAFDKLAIAADSLESLRGEANPGIEDALETALEIIGSLPDEEVYEENLKTVLGLAVREALGDSLSDEDFNSLRSVAAQCPYTGGLAVYRAPIWLPHEQGLNYIDIDWEENCSSPFVSSVNEKTTSPVVQVLPNPANEQVIVVLPQNSGNWYVTDLLGRQVMTGNILEARTRINTEQLPTGLYHLVCQFPSGQFSTAKFSIQH